MNLPIETALPALLAALRAGTGAVLVAPPGAGKTTGVPPALLAEPWAAGGRVIVTQPRRLAARAAAERMAALAGERVGETFGYRTRLDSAVGPRTRVEVVTDGVFVRAVGADPELAGVAAVLFDEVHERSLDGDLGLALALDARGGLRADLRIVAMSATLDGARLAALMGGAPVIESAGRAHAVALVHLGRDRTRRIEDEVARAVRRALEESPGSVLVFLPGVAEIERVAGLVSAPPGVAVHLLHGGVAPAEQRRAVAAVGPGGRKLVLATSIAETSITIDGVTAVIDSGLARRARHDRASGLTRLVTERVSQAAAAQRAGRAGRTAPGVCYRLWEAGETAGLPRFDPPELLEADLAPLVLALAEWGADAGALAWLDPPPVAALAHARGRLQALGALDGDGRPTAHGRRLAALPVDPALANMLVRGAEHGLGSAAGEVAMLLTERGLGGRAVDAEVRLAHWRADRSERAEAARAGARRLARAAGARAPDRDGGPDATAVLIALAHPERVARARGGGGGVYKMASGRAVRLEPGEALAREAWLAVAEAGGAASGARVMLAAALDPETIESGFAERIERRQHVRYDADLRSVVAEEVVRLGAITLRRVPLAEPDAALVLGALMTAVRAHGPALLPWPEAAILLRARARFARAADPALADLSDATLIADAEAWLPPVLDGVRGFGAVPPARLAAALEARLGRAGLHRLDALAPARFVTPAGGSHAIDYAADGGPSVAVRVQELFGLTEHPRAGTAPLTLVLLSPARRPIQTTADLPRFWAGSWVDVRRELRGRYPRHSWPEDPRAAPPTTRAKPRGT